MTIVRRRHLPFDIALGARLRQLRLARGMNQTAVADALGVSYQQVQKYEYGTNAVRSSHVGQLCQALGVTPDHLYQVNGAETRELRVLSSQAIRTAQKFDKLNADQKRIITILLTSFARDSR